MARADYLHRIDTVKGIPTILIEDLDLGRMTVTNNIEEVVEEIARMEKIDPKDYVIVYQDSEGVWDGYRVDKRMFVSLAADDPEEAVSTYINLRKDWPIA
jgi:hypothetical protein